MSQSRARLHYASNLLAARLFYEARVSARLDRSCQRSSGENKAAFPGFYMRPLLAAHGSAVVFKLSLSQRVADCRGGQPDRTAARGIAPSLARRRCLALSPLPTSHRSAFIATTDCAKPMRTTSSQRSEPLSWMARNRFRRFHVEIPLQTEGGNALSILWIILIVVLVLALLGFFARGV
jgi:hypothetical protein